MHAVVTSSIPPTPTRHTAARTSRVTWVVARHGEVDVEPVVEREELEEREEGVEQVAEVGRVGVGVETPPDHREHVYRVCVTESTTHGGHSFTQRTVHPLFGRVKTNVDG